MFALENQRSLAPVVGTALAAILSVIQEDEVWMFMYIYTYLNYIYMREYINDNMYI
jgi:hypothetical protein